MQIESIRIANFRAIRDLQVSFFRMSTLVGANNSGKSTVFRAIELFFDAAARVNIDDFHRKNVDDPIDIAITFRNLTEEERSEFRHALVNDTLTVLRQFTIRESSGPNYSVQASVFPAFAEFRSAESASQKLQLYRSIQQEYGLPPVRSADAADAALGAWEAENSDRLELTTIRGFFGATNVANGKLKKRTSLRLIPAVRDSSEEARTGRKSPVLELLSDITRQTFENREELRVVLAEAEAKVSQLTDPTTIPELAKIGSDISAIVQNYYGDTSVVADWERVEALAVNFPKPKILVTNNDVTTDVELVGHGLQRVILFSLIQYMAERLSITEREDREFSEPMSDIVLLVEEPEIYQHPIKQSILYRNFRKISSSFNSGNGIRIQILVATHSEKFVSMPDFEVCSFIRKTINVDGSIKNVVGAIKIADCSAAFAGFLEPPVTPMSDEAFVSKLHIFTRDICEGFFATKLILVEGETDKAVLEAYYEAIGRDAHLEGIQIIVVGGKGKLDKPAYLFDKVGIPTFVVFDNDSRQENAEKRAKAVSQNRFLQRVLGASQIDDMPVGCKARYYSFDGNIERYLKSVVGAESFDAQFEALGHEWGLAPADIKKTPGAFVPLLTAGALGGYDFGQLGVIVAAVDAL